MGVAMRLIAVTAFAGLLATAAHADQRTNSYSLTPGTCTAPIAVPVNNKPIFIMGSQTTFEEEGGGHVSFVRTNGPSPLLTWAGIDYHAGEERAYSAGHTAGVHIMWLDYGGFVDLQTAASDRLQVCSAGNNPLSRAVGYLTFMW
jgi:hypothetical protein